MDSIPGQGTTCCNQGPAQPNKQIIIKKKKKRRSLTLPDTVSGRYDNATFDHVLKIATYWPDEDAWDIEEFSKAKDVVIHAWCDIEPYGWKGVVQGDG